MNLTGTVSLVEALWTLAAIPGALYWFRNYRTARRSLRAVNRMAIGNGRRLWARFSVALTATFLGIEVVFLILGGVAMARVATPGSTLASTLVIAGGLIAASAAITFLAYRWQAVDDELLRAARADLTPRTPRTHREED